MRLSDWGPEAVQELNRRRPPSLGFTIVTMPPGLRHEHVQERLDTERTEGRSRLQTAAATSARASGAPGVDRQPVPGKPLERSQPQGFPAQGKEQAGGY